MGLIEMISHCYDVDNRQHIFNTLKKKFSRICTNLIIFPVNDISSNLECKSLH